jgi:hypothetical protein
MQQAAEAKQANLERNARLQAGTKSINALFQGSGGTPDKLDLSSLANTTGPAYDPFKANGTMWDEPSKSWIKDPSAQLGNGYSWGAIPPDANGKAQFAIFGPDGYKIATGDTPADLAKQSIYTGTSSGGSTGFDNAFYDKYRQSQLDYYLPQESEQYSGARTNLDYSLARAGQLNSSVAGMDVAKLAKQDALNQAQIGSQADTSTGQLRTQIQQEQQSALNQLYSTEDPSVAANTAENMVANAQLTKPILNPAGALFAPIIVGVGNALQGFTNPYAYINPTAGMSAAGGTTSGVGATSSGSGTTDQSGTRTG